MLQVVLVDDEPFILQGMKVLIDWEEEGFEIVKTASNGKEALEFIKENPVDLILADIQMPEMNGLDLLREVRKEKNKEIYFVILSGYADFSYAQQAIEYKCSEYILKPIQKDKLIEVLHKVRSLKKKEEKKKKEVEKMQQAYLARNLISVILGKYDETSLQYIESNLCLSEGVRYVEIIIDGLDLQEEYTEEEKREYQKRLYNICLEFLKEDAGHCIMDVSYHEKMYDIGFIYCDYMKQKKGQKERQYLQNFLDYLRKKIDMPIIMLSGKRVNKIREIPKSYNTVRILRSCLGLHEKKDIYYYEDEIQVQDHKIMVCKKSIDLLLKAIEEHQREEIIKAVKGFYEEMNQMKMSNEMINLNINYLLFQLIHLATEQDNTVNQEKVLRLISEGTFEEGIRRGSNVHLSRILCEYSNYLAQIRQNSTKGVIKKIEKEIHERYAENLTLKELSEKYYFNSAYLGQLFRKQYGKPFKDYLNEYRIEKATMLLSNTDEKVYHIAEMVGYHDIDYFVNRFIEEKGCTPAKFRKNMAMMEK